MLAAILCDYHNSDLNLTSEKTEGESLRFMPQVTQPKKAILLGYKPSRPDLVSLVI